MATLRDRARRAVGTVVPQPVKTRVWMARGLRSGEYELRALPKLLNRPGIVVDIGANRGMYAAYALRLGREVVAFEPHPQVAPQLRRILRGRATIHEVALSDHSETAVLRVPHTETGDVDTRSSLEPDTETDFAQREVKVRVARLDVFSLPPVALVKVDVEGHEAAVLRGSRETLKRDRPVVIVEIEEARQPGTFAAVSSTLVPLGYSGHWFDSDGVLRPLSEFEPAIHQRPEDRPRWGEGRGPLRQYVNNFVWMPADSPACP